MNITHPKQNLATQGLSTSSLQTTLAERLEEAMQQEEVGEETKKISNEAFHSGYARLEPRLNKAIQKEQEIAEARLAVAKELDAAQADVCSTQSELSKLEPRLSFSPKLPTPVMLSIMGQLGKKAGERAACVQREWSDVVGTAKALGMYRAHRVVSVAVGGEENGESGFTVIVTAAHGVFSCGGEDGDESEMSGIGHGGEGSELVPRLIEALSGKKVVGAAAGDAHTAVWTEEGALFTFGYGDSGQLGYGGYQNVPRLVDALVGKTVMGVAAAACQTVVWTEAGELFTFGRGVCGQLGHGEGQARSEYVPRLVEALSGKKVVGASVGAFHTAVWTDAGELFTFGHGNFGSLGHGGEESELVPRLVEALSGKKVVGASGGRFHTAVWTETGELFTFGNGGNGRLGHAGEQNEPVPRLVEALVGKKVVGAATGDNHTVVWTEGGELFTFGYGDFGRLGHGGTQGELVPRLLEALAGKKVVGAVAGLYHTAAWTDAGELFTFGDGRHGRLGHGGKENELMPRLVEAIAEV